MDDSDTKELLWEVSRLKLNCVHPEEVVTVVAPLDGGPEIKVPDVNEIEENLRL
jgi:hypothetical protein